MITLMDDRFLFQVLGVVSTFLHDLTPSFVEDDHLVLLGTQLLEEEKVTNLEVMCNGESCPPPIKACFTIQISQSHRPDAACVGLHGDLRRYLTQVWPEGFRNRKDP